MKKIIIALMLVFCVFVNSCSVLIDEEIYVNVEEPHFTYEFADVEKGKQLLMSNTEYHDNFSKADLEYKLQKKGATKEEYLEFAESKVMEFTEEEKKMIDKCMNYIEQIIVKEGYTLPEIDTVNFVKTTMEEEGNAAAYTHKSDIYLGADALKTYLDAPEEEQIYFAALMLHELFHCITRNNPDFRSEIYKVINFNVTGTDFKISPQIKERMISNPDVANHDAYATFTINGEKKDCFVVYLTTKEFENEGDAFFDNAQAHLIPVDSPDTVYTTDEVEDFWDVFGKNTYYVIDPEECLADNFYCAFLINQGDFKDFKWESPEILEKISTILKAESK